MSSVGERNGHRTTSALQTQFTTSHVDSDHRSHHSGHENHHIHGGMYGKGQSNDVTLRQANPTEHRSDIGSHLPERQHVREEEGDENSSVAGTSELSSIPPETGERVNTTVDSDASSVNPHMHVSHSHQPARPPVMAGTRVGEHHQGVTQELDKREHGQAHSHPLHIVHKMAPHRKKVDGRGNQVHNQLQDLQQVHPKYIKFVCVEEKQSMTKS